MPNKSCTWLAEHYRVSQLFWFIALTVANVYGEEEGQREDLAFVYTDKMIIWGRKKKEGGVWYWNINVTFMLRFWNLLRLLLFCFFYRIYYWTTTHEIVLTPPPPPPMCKSIWKQYNLYIGMYQWQHLLWIRFSVWTFWTLSFTWKETVTESDLNWIKILINTYSVAVTCFTLNTCYFQLKYKLLEMKTELNCPFNQK